MDPVYKSLAEIVGEGYVSNQPEELYIYSRADLGATEPHRPDYVVAPRTTEEVQAIVRLANRERIPIVPLGGGLALTGITMPLRGGIELDLKRMDSIIEVNERARYVVVECGVAQAKLISYLERHHPDLMHSEPAAPAQATIGGNVGLGGLGDLGQPYGFTADMINGLEVVLPTGEVCRTGSCSLSLGWFTQHPLPNLGGLFPGWFGTTGIITKLSIRLYPSKKIKGIELFLVDDMELVPEILFKISHTEMAGDLLASSRATRDLRSLRELHYIIINISGDSEKELEFKRELILDDTLGEYIRSGDGGLVGPRNAEARPPVTAVETGGFEYVGATVPVDMYPECCRQGAEIALRHSLPPTALARVIGRSHAMMFFWTYAFNRPDPESVKRVREAVYETDQLALKLGGIPWKPGVPGQRLIMERMEPNTLKLMKKIKQLLDPNGIMNPGNWEAM